MIRKELVVKTSRRRTNLFFSGHMYMFYVALQCLVHGGTTGSVELGGSSSGLG